MIVFNYDVILKFSSVFTNIRLDSTHISVQSSVFYCGFYLLHFGFFARLCSSTLKMEVTFLRNVGWLSADYMTYPRR
jgi:hypothetical protein